MKLYEMIKDLMTRYPKLRDSDRLLMWNIWGKRGSLQSDLFGSSAITKEAFMLAVSPESIRRCRQKLQEKYPELRSSKKVQEEKDEISAQKGTHIYREKV